VVQCLSSFLSRILAAKASATSLTRWSTGKKGAFRDGRERRHGRRKRFWLHTRPFEKNHGPPFSPQQGPADCAGLYSNPRGRQGRAALQAASLASQAEERPAQLVWATTLSTVSGKKSGAAWRLPNIMSYWIRRKSLIAGSTCFCRAQSGVASPDGVSSRLRSTTR